MGSQFPLTRGALKTIMQGGKVDHPTLQVVTSKKMPSTSNQEKERYRVFISDGQFKVSHSILSTQTLDVIGPNGLEEKTIFKLHNYSTNMIKTSSGEDARIILMYEIEVLQKGSEVPALAGNPVPYTAEAAASASNSDRQSNEVPAAKVQKTEPVVVRANNPPQELNQSLVDSQIISRIVTLSPYHNKWVIKARVSNKSNIRTWANSRGEGKLFNMDLIDDSGEIRCTAFRDLVDKFYDYIEVDKVYYISKCTLKMANQQFSTLNNPYEMTMTEHTIVERCDDDQEGIPRTRYDFIKLDKVACMEPGTKVDVIGVCKAATDLVMLTSRNTNKELKKRDVTLIDESKTAMALTLWGNDAETFDGSGNPVVVIKGAKVGEFGGGKTISTMMNSQLRINPDMPECFRLKGWYDLEGYQMDFTNVSARSGGSNANTPWLSFQEVQTQVLGNSEKGDYYQNKGTILLARSENSYYKACPTEECNKKVVDLQNGMYRCEKCNREYPNFKYRLLLSVNVADSTGNQWMNMFSTEAEKVLGKTAQEVGQLFESDPAAAAKLFENANFKQFIFKCRAKMETYNDEGRLKTVAMNVQPLDYKEHNNHLVASIEKFLS